MAQFTLLTTALFLALMTADQGWPQSVIEEPTDRLSVRLPLYGAADENADVVGTLTPGESTTPMAETQNAAGHKWFLVKTKAGVVGWIRQADNAQSKKLDSYFRSLPREASISVTIPIVPASSAPTGSIVVPVRIIHNSIIVPVILNRTLTANLLLDTGASMTMISRRIAAGLALYATGSRHFSGVGGKVTAKIARVDSLTVGAAEIKDMVVSIHDLSQDPRFEGLLGMDFLSRFHVSVDAQKRLLVLTPR